MSFHDFLTQTATIQNATESNIGGIPKKAWADLHTGVPARLVANRGSTKTATEHLERSVRGEYTLFLLPTEGLDNTMRVRMDEKIYEITFVAPIRRTAELHHLELQLNRLQ